jgi:hypothetical protein
VTGGCANDYVYVKGDPINNNDPNGNMCQSDATGIALGVASLVFGIVALFTGGVAAILLGAGGALLGMWAVEADSEACFLYNDVGACTAAGLGVLGAGFGLGVMGAGIGEGVAAFRDATQLAQGYRRYGTYLGMMSGMAGAAALSVDATNAATRAAGQCR